MLTIKQLAEYRDKYEWSRMWIAEMANIPYQRLALKLKNLTELDVQESMAISNVLNKMAVDVLSITDKSQ